mmetsp:Transcript_71185/g.219670  ORF Transcript_71185/g.219670 Transcript_71185/m.219670 type:complete len:316 (-) Transcript_71185:1114-2061(-)
MHQLLEPLPPLPNLDWFLLPAPCGRLPRGLRTLRGHGHVVLALGEEQRLPRPLAAARPALAHLPPLVQAIAVLLLRRARGRLHGRAPDPRHGFRREVHARANLRAPSFEDLGAALRQHGDDLPSPLPKASHATSEMEVHLGFPGQAQDVHRLHPIVVETTADALETDKDWRGRLPALLALLEPLPRRRPHRQGPVLSILEALVQDPMPLCQLHRVVLLVVGVLLGPAARPVPWVVPQCLMDAFGLVEAPLAQLLDRVADRDTHSAADDEHGGDPRLPGLQGVMEAVQERRRQPFRDRPAGLAKEPPLLAGGSPDP